MPQPFRTTRLVEFHDTDMAGIMHFASFFHYMESAEHELIRSVGFSVHVPVDGQILSFPRVAASCDYRSPARSEEVLDIDVSLTKIGNKSLHYHFEFSHAGRAVATGSITSVCCRVTPGEPMVSVALPDEIREKLGQFLVGGQ
ncbi:MAG: thioesterase family protein [Planctomycetota bacterium]